MSNKKNNMKAVVLEKPCTADELKIQNIEIPKVINKKSMVIFDFLEFIQWLKFAFLKFLCMRLALCCESLA